MEDLDSKFQDFTLFGPVPQMKECDVEKRILDFLASHLKPMLLGELTGRQFLEQIMGLFPSHIVENIRNILKESNSELIPDRTYGQTALMIILFMFLDLLPSSVAPSPSVDLMLEFGNEKEIQLICGGKETITLVNLKQGSTCTLYLESMCLKLDLDQLSDGYYKRTKIEKTMLAMLIIPMIYIHAKTFHKEKEFPDFLDREVVLDPDCWDT